MIILGISHVVAGVKDLDAAELFLAGKGFRPYGERAFGVNPFEKAPYVKGALDTRAGEFAMRLMVSKSGTPPVELLSESLAASGLVPQENAFEAVLNSFELKDLKPSGMAGFWEPVSAGLTGPVSALIVRCRELENTLFFWRLLGFDCQPLDGKSAVIKVRAFTSRHVTPVYFMEEPGRGGVSWLNNEGVVCLSFLCKDAVGLREYFIKRGFEPGGYFYLSPFGRRICIFFIRNRGGELYEFLSAA
jgi:hypothetical protein